uniref:Uncharacterized protein n=1 Tax=Fagus sylvatica TaxID=28930 RepID=A0A2N9FN84_FAGSY
MVKPKRARGSEREKKRKSQATKARRKTSESLFRSSESDPLILKRQRFVSEKSAGSSSNFSTWLDPPERERPDGLSLGATLP